MPWSTPAPVLALPHQNTIERAALNHFRRLVVWDDTDTDTAGGLDTQDSSKVAKAA